MRSPTESSARRDSPLRLAGRAPSWQCDSVTPVTSARGVRPQRRPSGSGEPGGAQAWPPLRALVVLVVAVGLGIYLIGLGSGGYAPAASGTIGTPTNVGTRTPPSTTPPSTTPPSSTTTTAGPPGTAQPSKTVTVLVANASQTNGVAAYFSSKLSGAGWGTLTPVTAATTESSSAVYYASGRQQDALAVASAVGVSSSSVQPLSGAAVPVAGATRADVVVVAGDDLASTMSSSRSSGSAGSAGGAGTSG